MLLAVLIQCVNVDGTDETRWRVLLAGGASPEPAVGDRGPLVERPAVYPTRGRR